MSIDIDSAWAAGLLLSMIRLGAFVLASPILSKVVPAAGRVAFVVALGAFFAEPVSSSLGLGDLLVAGVVNAAVGVVLGFITGIIFHLFSAGGSLIDDTSGLRAGAIIDPVTGAQSAVFSRAFNLIALVLFLAIGGDRLMVRGMGASFQAIPVDGSISLPSGFADGTVDLIGRMLVAALELAVPAVAALFAAEVVLGVAARFAPRANVFLIGLPAKVLTALATVGLVMLLVPETLSGSLRVIEQTFIDVIDGLLG